MVAQVTLTPQIWDVAVCGLNYHSDVLCGLPIEEIHWKLPRSLCPPLRYSNKPSLPSTAGLKTQTDTPT
ncbi:hypothetical protein VNO77_40893 [Canavalia gladiata]|uniref:Uncharacterized protein n=1 Tax=Canavalia gladiata TaxID=3824 RepID=A0AAN9K0F4_CANGL